MFKKLVATCAIAICSSTAAQAADFWWPKGGEEVGYNLFIQGKKVGQSRLSFSVEDDTLFTVQEQRIKAELIAGMKTAVRITFRERWRGDEFLGMSTFGKAKTPAGDIRLRVEAKRDEKGMLFVESEIGDREAGLDRLPATFWHLTHITSPEIFDPFVGGFSNLDIAPIGPQTLEIDGDKKECLGFDLHITYESRDEFGTLPPGVDPEDVPLERKFKGWFEPDGLMCALLVDTPIGKMAMFRAYRKTGN